MELWPGYTTSIGQYEREILMNAEINFKVLRMDTAYDLFRRISENSRDFRVMVYFVSSKNSILPTTGSLPLMTKMNYFSSNPSDVYFQVERRLLWY